MSPEEIEALTEQLHNGNDWQKVEANRRLTRLTGADMHRLLEWSSLEWTDRDYQTSIKIIWGVIQGFLGTGLIICGFVLLDDRQWMEASFWEVCGTLFLYTAVRTLAPVNEPKYHVERAALTRVNDPGVVPSLLSGLSGAKPPVREYIIEALHRLMGHVKASDFAIDSPLN